MAAGQYKWIFVLLHWGTLSLYQRAEHETRSRRQQLYSSCSSTTNNNLTIWVAEMFHWIISLHSLRSNVLTDKLFSLWRPYLFLFEPFDLIDGNRNNRTCRDMKERQFLSSFLCSFNLTWREFKSLPVVVCSFLLCSLNHFCLNIQTGYKYNKLKNKWCDFVAMEPHAATGLMEMNVGRGGPWAVIGWWRV